MLASSCVGAVSLFRAGGRSRGWRWLHSVCPEPPTRLPVQLRAWPSTWGRPRQVGCAGGPWPAPGPQQGRGAAESARRPPAHPRLDREHGARAGERGPCRVSGGVFPAVRPVRALVHKSPPGEARPSGPSAWVMRAPGLPSWRQLTRETLSLWSWRRRKSPMLGNLPGGAASAAPGACLLPPPRRALLRLRERRGVTERDGESGGAGVGPGAAQAPGSGASSLPPPDPVGAARHAVVCPTRCHGQGQGERRQIVPGWNNPECVWEAESLPGLCGWAGRRQSEGGACRSALSPRRGAGRKPRGHRTRGGGSAEGRAAPRVKSWPL